MFRRISLVVRRTTVWNKYGSGISWKTIIRDHFPWLVYHWNSEKGNLGEGMDGQRGRKTCLCVSVIVLTYSCLKCHILHFKNFLNQHAFRGLVEDTVSSLFQYVLPMLRDRPSSYCHCPPRYSSKHCFWLCNWKKTQKHRLSSSRSWSTLTADHFLEVCFWEHYQSSEFLEKVPKYSGLQSALS